MTNSTTWDRKSQMNKDKPPTMSLTRGPDGQWKFAPPFAGGSYQAFKAWHVHAQEAVEEYLRLHDPMHHRVVRLGVPDWMAVSWDALSDDDAITFATEAIESGEADEILSISWDFGTPTHGGIETIWKIGKRFFADLQDGMFGPFSSLDEALEQTERNQPPNSGLIYESESLSASEIARCLRGEYLDPGEEILINDERWAANPEKQFVTVNAGK